MLITPWPCFSLMNTACASVWGQWPLYKYLNPHYCSNALLQSTHHDMLTITGRSRAFTLQSTSDLYGRKSSAAPTTRNVLGAFAKLPTATISFVMSVCLRVRVSILLHGTNRLPLDGFSWYLVLQLISGFHRALLRSITFISRLNALDYIKLRG